MEEETVENKELLLQEIPTAEQIVLNGTFQRVANEINQIEAAMQRAAAVIGPAIEKLAQVYAASKPALEAVQQLTEAIAAAVAQADIPEVSEQRLQELILSHKKWGTFGWTMPPNAPLKCFYDAPVSMEEANAKMRKLCTKQEIAQLLDKLRGCHLKKSDLEEAITCYHNRQYKACALILCGVIDAKIIRKQGGSDKDRKLAGKASKIMRERLESDSEEQFLHILLYGVNLFTCLETIFAKADNFKNEPDNINRDFISHGMTIRPVRQRDCIQLFLALYNLSLILKFV